MLFLHCVCRAASRAACTAGSSSEINRPMIEITTSSSTNVKPSSFDERFIGLPVVAFFCCGFDLVWQA